VHARIPPQTVSPSFPATRSPVASTKSEFKGFTSAASYGTAYDGCFLRWNNIENNINNNETSLNNKTNKMPARGTRQRRCHAHVASVTGCATYSLPARENRKRLKRFASLQRHLTHDTLFLLSLRCLSPTLTPLLAWFFFVCVRTGRHSFHRHKTGKSPYELRENDISFAVLTRRVHHARSLTRRLVCDDDLRLQVLLQVLRNFVSRPIFQTDGILVFFSLHNQDGIGLVLVIDFECTKVPCILPDESRDLRIPS